MLAKGVNISVQQIVQQLEIYNLARSSSSIMDQSMFRKPRVEDLSNLSSQIYTTKNVPFMVYYDTTMTMAQQGSLRQATTLEVMITHARNVGAFKTLRCEHLLWATNGVRLTRYKYTRRIACSLDSKQQSYNEHNASLRNTCFNA